MINRLLPALGLALILAAPAAAAPFCTGDRPGVQSSLGLTIGGPYTAEEQNSFDMMLLRQQGVDVTRVERWNGCIRAFVRKPGGGEEMRFFEPGSLRPVY
ncbi:MAG: hypothetical protein ACO1O4_09055 [Devosia sp.]